MFHLLKRSARKLPALTPSTPRYGRHHALSAMTSSTPASTTSPDIVLDSFAHRQFDDADYGGTKIALSKPAFMQRVLTFYEERKAVADEFRDRPVLVDGYAPFCKHVFMPNFDDGILDGAVRITEENEALLKCAYETRKEGELPVLVRFFPKGSVHPPVAKYLDLILYSREQIAKERKAMGEDDGTPLEDAPWRLIGIKGQAVPYEIPMTPITMMRNELITQGGSGVPIDRDAYLKSVAYWKEHAIVQ